MLQLVFCAHCWKGVGSVDNLICGFSGIALSFSAFRIMLAMGFYIQLLLWQVSSSSPAFFETFYYDWIWQRFTFFLHLLRSACDFFCLHVHLCGLLHYGESFDVCLYSVCKYFVEHSSICAHQRPCPPCFFLYLCLYLFLLSEWYWLHRRSLDILFLLLLC